MKLPFLASFIIFLLVVRHAIKRQQKSEDFSDKSFWAREREANSVRRKPLDTLNYILIPFERFPMNCLTEHPQIMEYQQLLQDLSQRKIVNLTGYTNTDLKLEYGTANITALSEYDQNYTILVRTLQQWADILLDAGYVSEATVLMEFAISTGTDISRTYYKLAEIYSARGDNFQIQQLLEQSRNLRSANAKIIARTLQESYL